MKNYEFVSKVNYDELTLYVEFNQLLKRGFIDYDTLINILKIDESIINDLIYFRNIHNLSIFYKIENYYNIDFFSVPKNIFKLRPQFPLGIGQSYGVAHFLQQTENIQNKRTNINYNTAIKFVHNNFFSPNNKYNKITL